ncbi:MAG: DUF4302 domain-containing protein [Paludibacteraceae bacterium]
MKRKSIIYITFTCLMTLLFLSSCKFEEENIFSETSAVRIEKALSDYKDILCASPNGWVMEYFPTTETEGYTYLMKFETSTKVTMATKNRWTNYKYTTDSCTFRLIGDDGPVLSFPTAGTYKVNGIEIGIFHLFTNPQDPAGTDELDGYGLEGDYEFVVMSATSDLIMLKGKKRGTDVRLRKLDENMVWADYFTQIDEMKSKIINKSIEELQLVFAQKDTFTIKTNITYQGSNASIFRIYPVGGDNIIDGVNYPYIITPTGLRLYTPYSDDNQKAQTFVLSDNEQQLICTDENSDAVITTSPAYLFNNLINARKYIIFKYTSENMSTSIYDAFLLLSNAVVNTSRKLEHVGFTNNKDYGTALSIYTTKNTSKIEGFLNYDIVVTSGNELSLTFKGFTGKYDKNGQNYYNNFKASTLIHLLEDNYTLSLQGAALSSTTFRFTSKTDTSKWFILTLK